MNTLYVLMRLRTFDFRGKEMPSLKANIQLEEGTVGYLQVFDTREHAEAALSTTPGPADILEIMEGGATA